MFRFRRSKSEKPTHSPKLSGMPALKQKRSSEREESLFTKVKPVMSSLSELENLRTSKVAEIIHLSAAKPEENSPMVIAPNYKRPVSPSSGEQREIRQPNYIDRISNGQNSNIAFYDEVPHVITDDIPEEDEEAEPEPTGINSDFRMSKGDSGYKSKDDGNTENKKKKVKKTRKKSNQRKLSATSGLHDIKQQRKACRESVSQSMRALTPKERECIQCLEEVLKNHPDGEESFDEVFDSDSSGPDLEDEMNVPIKKGDSDEGEEEAIDYGYASVNDVSRKYSLESTESVGSIIDLVGNLSTSPSCQTPPVYAAVDFTKKRRNVRSSDDIIDTAYNDATLPRDEMLLEKNCIAKSKYEVSSPTYDLHKDNDVFMEPEEAMTYLDDAINSFSIQTDEEEGEEEPKKERKKDKRSKAHKSKESSSDGEKERKRRERRKKRDPEKERERKERKKKRKEEKRKKREKADEAKRREENIAKHVDEISALTQDMIKTAQQEEPVYAQVNKPKKENMYQKHKDNEDLEKLPSPPSPFSSPTELDRACEINSQTDTSTSRYKHTERSSQIFLTDLEKKIARAGSPERHHNVSKVNLTSTPVSSSGKFTHNSMYDVSSEVRTSPVQGPRRPASDSTQYASPTAPHFSKFQPQISGRMVVSPSMLQDSTRSLKHVDKRSSTGKVMEINPERNSVKETKSGAISPTVSNDSTPKTHYEKRTESPKSQTNFYRRHPPVSYDSRPGRPVSLNLDKNGNLASLAEEKKSSILVKPYSSFREEKHDPKDGGGQGQKPRPFVITTLKKPIQLY